MKAKTFIYLLLFTPSVLFTISCKKDFEFDKIKPVSWNPDFALPLVNDVITFESALKVTGGENNFYIDDAGDISMLYYFKEDAFHLSPSDLITLPSFPFVYDHLVTPQEQQVIASQDLNIPPITYTFNLNQADPTIRVDKLLIRTGSIVLTMNNTFSNDGHLVLRFPHATKDGVPFVYTTRSIVAGMSSETIDLSGVQFDLTTSSSVLTVLVESSLKKSDHPVANDRVHVDFTLQIPKIGWFEGFLGQRILTPDEASVKVTVFNNAYALGDVYFIDPKASITLVNSLGIPAKVTILKLKATNTGSAVSADITDQLGDAAIVTIPSPLITDKLSAQKCIDYSNANTNGGMETLFNIKPDQVTYKIKTEINPSKSGVNFFSDTSSMYANLQVKLPLYGHFNRLTVQDTFDFSVNRQRDIESAVFKTNLVNGFPLQAVMQVYFVNSSYQIVDSLAGKNCILVNEAPVDPATHLPRPGANGTKDTTFYFDKARMDKLVDANHILVRAVMNSCDNGVTNVKIKATQQLVVHLSADLKMVKTIGTKK
jgi:hypothetical protein